MPEEAVVHDMQGQAGYEQRMHEPALRRYLGVLRRRVWTVVTVFVILATLGTINVYKATPIYQGVAKVLIKRVPPAR